MEITSLSDLQRKHQELQKYSNTQFNQIMQLQKQLGLLQEENSHLKDLLSKVMPVVQEEAKTALSDEELIAEREIKKLRKVSEESVLTYEECKKLIEYVKILQAKRSKEKNKDTEKLSTEDLLKSLDMLNIKHETHG